jgi:hypothetical protein
VPEFLRVALDQRSTHGICPTCFAEGPGGVATGGSILALHAGSLYAAVRLGEELRAFGVRERADFVLETTIPAGDDGFVEKLLSRVAGCLSANGLDPVRVRLGSQSYVLDGQH